MILCQGIAVARRVIAGRGPTAHEDCRSDHLLKRPGRRDRRTRCVGSMPTSPIGLEVRPSRAGRPPKSSGIRASFIRASASLSDLADKSSPSTISAGTCEQSIKGGNGAIKWTRLSCQVFAANAVRLQLHALAYNLGDFLRTLATPEPIEDWLLTCLKEKLIMNGAKVISHGRYLVFQNGRGCYYTADVPEDSAADRGTAAAAAPRQHETPMLMRSQTARGVRPNPMENDPISPSIAVRTARVTAVVRATRLSCQNAGKAQKFTAVRGSSGESRLELDRGVATWESCL